MQIDTGRIEEYAELEEAFAENRKSRRDYIPVSKHEMSEDEWNKRQVNLKTNIKMSTKAKKARKARRRAARKARKINR